jgi:RHH-type transcriptional regulator, proline utilization regulon repressor / proline dehydrogenase / delta 1-pyrroline-5-carboxylate dehydrogenase
MTPHASLKLSGLAPRFDPIDAQGSEARVLARIAPLMRQIIAVNGALTIDMESYELKALVLQIFRTLVDSYPSAGWLPGIALQAYLPETERDVAELITWARSRGRRISVRLVKGAYWDTEVALAHQRNWPLPVFVEKAETDLSFERLTLALFAARDVIYPAIAGHNLRSLAHAIAAARERGLARGDWEIQMLYGMAEPLQRAIAQYGVALRVYVPTGELVTGIAYLIRRLLENTASSSILRQTYVEGHATEALLAPPRPNAQAPVAKQPVTFSNTPLIDFSRVQEWERFAHALSQVRSRLGHRYGLRVPGVQQTAESFDSRNPARPSEVLGMVDLTDATGAMRAMANAKAAFPQWRDTPAAQRIALSRRAARLIEARRAELAAWEVLEQGKNWREADADVGEAIDYLEFYASEMERLDGWRATITFPGETNVTRFEARGVAVIISPWNFPLAILTGMTSAALVAGNCAIMKPAMPALIVAHLLHSILLEAGFPPDVCQLVPGRGSVIGDVLVDHPDVQLIAFTGSREVGLRILERSAKAAPGQLHVKRVVCEMGGKNAIIVDDDADLDEAVHQTLHSAFGYQGQKCSACSRVITVGAAHDRFVERLAAALAAYPYGSPEDPQFIFGPLITRDARQKVLDYIEIGKSEGRLVYEGCVPDEGHYAPPAIFTDILPHHRLAQDEIFGPVLAVLRANTFDEALDIALESKYALTGGVFSRLPDHLARARERFRVGDLYLNRRITGARVGAQPFGGYRFSGMGIPAGGEEYLKQFMWSRVVTENTIRHGYVP